jgi:hypothetical protein
VAISGVVDLIGHYGDLPAGTEQVSGLPSWCMLSRTLGRPPCSPHHMDAQQPASALPCWVQVFLALAFVGETLLMGLHMKVSTGTGGASGHSAAGGGGRVAQCLLRMPCCGHDHHLRPMWRGHQVQSRPRHEWPLMAACSALRLQHNPLDQLLHLLLTSLMVCCAVVCLAEAAFPRSLLLALARPLFVMLQGSWFIEVGHMLFQGAGRASWRAGWHHAACTEHGTRPGFTRTCSAAAGRKRQGTPTPAALLCAGVYAWDMRDHAAVMAAPVIFTLHILGFALLFLAGAGTMLLRRAWRLPPAELLLGAAVPWSQLLHAGASMMAAPGLLSTPSGGALCVLAGLQCTCWPRRSPTQCWARRWMASAAMQRPMAVTTASPTAPWGSVAASWQAQSWSWRIWKTPASAAACCLRATGLARPLEQAAATCTGNEWSG